MAWLEQKSSGTFHVVFRISKEKYRKSLKTKLLKEALSRKLRIEENIQLVELGRLTITPDADLVSFLLSDGKINKPVSAQKRISLGKLHETFVKNLPADAMEENTLRTAANHMRHVVRILGGRKQVKTITTTDLQTFVNTRSKEPGMNGRTVSSQTIKKELATLRTIWNWSRLHGYTNDSLPLRGVKFPKYEERQPFRTREEIERLIASNEFSEAEIKEVWECLYLRATEIKELLETVAEKSDYSHVYPMVAVASYTGARRSELCRMLTTDVDLENGTLLIRERKRSKSKRTFRQVPIASSLNTILQSWLNDRPESVSLFPSMEFDRISKECRVSTKAATAEEASSHLDHALRHSRWEVARGWHVFRHSFISNCASRGIDQRMIDDWVGHQTDEQRKRYRHLFPDTQKKELDRVF